MPVLPTGLVEIRKLFSEPTSHITGVIAGHVLDYRNRDPEARAAITGDLEQQAEAAKREGFDLDAMLDADLQEPPRPAPKLTLADLDLVIQHPAALPPGVVVKKLQDGEYAYQTPDLPKAVRITTRPDYFDEHSESLELWSQGSPTFPEGDIFGSLPPLDYDSLSECLSAVRPLA